MEFLNPEGYFIYSKSDCKYCVEVNKLLDDLSLKYESKECVFNSDDEKKTFLDWIKERNNGKSWNTFPMVFYNGQFIGGYKETGIHLEKINAFNDSFDF